MLYICLSAILTIPCIVSFCRYRWYKDRIYSLASFLCGTGFILSAFVCTYIMYSFSAEAVNDIGLFAIFLSGFTLFLAIIIFYLAGLTISLIILLIYTCITVRLIDNKYKSDKYKWILISVCLLIQAVFPFVIYFLFR